MIRSAAKKFFSRQLARPTGLFGKLVMGRLLNRSTLSHNELVFEELAVEPTDKILEIGFGGGALLERAAHRASGGFIAGIEISEEMVESVSVRLKDLISERRVELRHGSIERLPYPERHFDSVCSVNTIYFWPDLAAAFREIHRVLRPGGKLVLGYLAEADIRGAGLDTEGFLAYSTEELRRTLEEAGFRAGGTKSGKDRRGTFYTLSAERLS